MKKPTSAGTLIGLREFNIKKSNIKNTNVCLKFLILLIFDSKNYSSL